MNLARSQETIIIHTKTIVFKHSSNQQLGGEILTKIKPFKVTYKTFRNKSFMSLCHLYIYTKN